MITRLVDRFVRRSDRPVAIRVAFAVVLTALPAAAPAAQDPPAEPTSIPQNVRVSPMLQPVFAMLLEKSATFRRQCSRIAAARHVRVTVLSAPSFQEQAPPRARASIARHVYGLIQAVIEIPVSPDLPELLAHELEHVIEQVDGVDLLALAAAGVGGVFEVDPGVFETARARAAGRAVLRDLFGETDPALKRTVRRVGRALRIGRPVASQTTPVGRWVRH